MYPKDRFVSGGKYLKTSKELFVYALDFLR